MSAPSAPLRRGRSSVSDLHAHLVFVVKYRRPVFTDALLVACREVMAQSCARHDAVLVEFNGEADHVHLLVDYPPALALSGLVNHLKGVSARRLRQQFPAHVRRYLWGGHFWSPSYFAASCGGAPLDLVRQYIDNQRRPHAITRPPGHSSRP